MKRLFTASQMQAADKAAIERGTTALKLMQNAGKTVAKVCLKEFPKAKKVLVLCGKGNNGGDAYVVGQYLLDKGLDVILLEPKQSPNSNEAIICQNNYLAKAKTKILNKENTKKYLENSDLVIDAIFGSGLNRAATGELAEVMKIINQSKKNVLSIDIPSGIIADRPELIGEHIRANLTVQLAGAKISSVFYPTKYAYGKTKVVNIGISKKILKEKSSIKILDNKAVKIILPKRKADAHKYNIGTVLLVAGSAQYSGAAELAARGALRAGAGLVTLASTNRFYNSWPEIIFKKISLKNTLKDIEKIDKRYASVRVIGPGLSKAMSKNISQIIAQSDRPTILDASALIANEKWTKAVQEHGNCILTPHFGEAAHLLASSSQTIANDPIKAAKEISKKFRVITVLKSATTVITDGNNVLISTAGHAGMATGGSGDVLAGVIGAFVAQSDNLLNSTASAVYIHGKAGELVAKKYGNGLIAGDLANAFTQVWKNLSK